MKRRSPYIAHIILKLILTGEDFNEKSGDLEEVYNYILVDTNKLNADIWYWQQILKAIPTFIENSFYWGVTMLKNHIKIALRNILQQKMYSSINVFGLALGLACAILIYTYVIDELNVNQFNENIDDIYWVSTMQKQGADTLFGYGSPPALGPALEREYPEILYTARVNNGSKELLLNYQGDKYTEQVKFIDLSAFNIFSFDLLSGKLPENRTDPNVLVISESTAQKYFGNENPINKIISVEGKYSFRVAAVMSDIKRNSTIRFDIAIPIEFLETFYDTPGYTETWGNCSFQTYALFQQNTSYEKLNEKIFELIKRNISETRLFPFLYPFDQMYLEIYGTEDRITVYSIIALLILIIACINFMNLSTARAARRAKEIGLRKVVGAGRKQIALQFIGESFFITLISLCLGFILAWIIFPQFKELNSLSFEQNDLFRIDILIGIVVISIFTGFISGSYPAILLSGFKPVKVLRRDVSSGNSLFRKILVLSQFAVSIALMIYTYVVYYQVQYMIDRDLGFNKEQLVYIPLKGELKQNSNLLKNELLKESSVISATVTSHSPTGIYTNSSGWEWEGKDEGLDLLVTFFNIDPDFLTTFDVQMEKGEFFSEHHSGNHVVINETFAELTGFESPIGKTLIDDGDPFQIIGIIKDFHFKPMHIKIEPLVLVKESDWVRDKYIFVKLNSSDIRESIAKIENIVTELNPAFPFEYNFLDEDYNTLYQREEKQDAIIRSYAIIAIIISCLGLFGLAAFMAEKRTKEIGIRKVLGASIPNIIILLIKEFSKWVLYANIIAWPIGYYLADKWLTNYAYKIDLTPWIFLATGSIALIISILTVGFQAIRSAKTNPVDSLKYE
ncbi:ABC transporter permease [Bacteroidota bacterium]